jgi:hypothetical protein
MQMNNNRHPARGKGRQAQASAAAVELFAACVFKPGDLVEVRLIPAGEQMWCLAERLAGQVPKLIDANEAGANVYVGVNPRSRRGGKEEDVVRARCLFADFDDTDLKLARSRWAKAGLPSPTMTLASGNGVHAYWRLTGSIADLDDWRELQRAMIAALGSDPRIHDPPRIMRLPGFDNQKYDPPIPCRIVRAVARRRYPLAKLRRILAPHLSTELAARRKVPSRAPSPINLAGHCLAAGERVARCLAAMLRVPVADHSDGSQRLLLVARQCVRYALDDDTALELIGSYSAHRPFPRQWNDDEILRRLRDAETRCQRGEALLISSPKQQRRASRPSPQMELDPKSPPSVQWATTRALARRIRAINKEHRK